MDHSNLDGRNDISFEQINELSNVPYLDNFTIIRKDPWKWMKHMQMYMCRSSNLLVGHC